LRRNGEGTSVADRSCHGAGLASVLTVAWPNLIVVVEDGRICESNTHEALLAAVGRYATMFELQAKAYR
jgi:hypothetical protein